MSARCPQCGARYGAEARFCPQDGTRLVITSPIASDAPSIPASRRTTEPVQAVGPGMGEFARMVGQILQGRYRVERKIGEGGMSFVYLATDLETKERVAVKILSPQIAHEKNAMARLRREAELAGRLQHPNVCHIAALGETEGGMVFVVMPFVEGELLCDRTVRLGHISLEETVRLVKDIAAGLEAAHQVGIIHRDLKPENVMLCKDPDGTERAVVMDFGLAKERHVGSEVEKLTATGIVLGTPEFMSPEQLRGKPLDARSDVYALGLMTYEMLTGKLPFDGVTQQDIMVARLKSEPTPIREKRPELGFSTAVEKVLLKAMERLPAERYQTAPEFADALAGAAGNERKGMLDRLLRR
ncbi:MAG: serine/threonine protein kinase [Gemmatimonadota bacterium]|nr:serine/threonine protein kinase [Gemmatimonadota bacterium]